MSELKDKLEGALDDIKETVTETPKGVVKAAYTAAERRLEHDWLGRVAVIVSFILIGFANMGLSWLEGEGFVTPLGMVFVMGGLILYVAYRLVIMGYNYCSLRLQERAVMVDIEEAKAHRAQLENQNYLLSKEHERDRAKSLFMKQQNRKDLKLHQDLELRQPFFEQMQSELVALFARENIADALQGASTFADSVERMDDILLKRTDIDITFEQLSKSIIELNDSYKEIGSQVAENAEMLNQSIQREAVLMVKYKENELAIQALRNDFKTIASSLDSIVDILKAGMPAPGSGLFSASSSSTEKPSEGGEVKVNITVNESPSIATELENLLIEEEKKKDLEGELDPPPD